MSHEIALIVGGGINQEITPEVLRVIDAAGVSISWNRVDVDAADYPTAATQLQAAAELAAEMGLALKTRLLTPPGGPTDASNNLNVVLRRQLGLYAGVRAIRSLPGVSKRFPDLDLIIIRENSEDIYKGIEHEIVPGVVESIKVVTRDACERIARFAFETARYLEREHLTFVHKANIMKKSDGLFLSTVREVAEEYPDVPLRTVIVDAACMQLVLDPYQFDVLLMGNLYGDVLSSLCNGITGGISSSLGIDIGDDVRIYEAVHGDAASIVGKGIANPLPLLTPVVDLLHYIGEGDAAEAIGSAIEAVTTAGETLTPDLGGSATTTEMTDAIIAGL
ncbi:MAG: NAD-dependent isocitrate dehydrogenase [Acidimicrobiia bacterium]|nr:NAD-dependent isocitrate dehydrogenase [Acidimicrobiia bacterium]NNF09156.1 NAD-dependent isocitrate dehydrogenase [Acidimicrobiia bacterium]NNL69986.1 NAD-dependent isocitrate dehydrogenase [Acidimicrobiia bacterium]